MVVAMANGRMQSREVAVADAHPATFEVFGIDDTQDPFEGKLETSPASDDGLDVRWERVPDGHTNRKVNFVQLTLTPNEAKDHAMARLNHWLATIPLPEGMRFGIEEIRDFDSETTTSKLVALRTYVLRGTSALRSEDVTDASDHVDSSREPADVYVALTLSREGAQRFAEFTSEYAGRRIALVVDGEVMSAPLVKSTIAGGHISLSLGQGNEQVLREQARHLAGRLRAH
jgi:hypothetical protein